ncbi:carbohydrate ABC transporter permease [Paenibacillus allorhizosphaerae]|uniref:L-arabinose transport system permease protein AraQ n=1 Tax=Paenibacillus allorhizosphaerae TaxID=2849866 RepID=A0ABN7TF97_9BACL|nr:carbohydrate ABC transporter permease [Paenibacillus allorhizosphaerae]CAG7617340.1 L-arabinose transport system permease protein AraQ [Paenibacillus allorhizosphaerae]
MRYLKNGLMYLLAAIWIIPLAWTVLTSFRPRDLIVASGWTLQFTFDNYIRAWDAAPFGQYYVNTIEIVIGILAVQLVTVILAAYAFARLRFWGKDVLLMLVMMQIMVPPDILIVQNYQVLKSLHLIDTKLGIMIPYFASAFGTFLLRQTFKSVPYELEEAARMDGCNVLQIIMKVYAPLAIPSIISFGIVSISHHWNAFLWPLIVTNSPENRPLTVGLAIFAHASETGAQFAEVTAATLIIAIPLLVGFFTFQKGFINSFMHSGVK